MATNMTPEQERAWVAMAKSRELAKYVNNRGAGRRWIGTETLDYLQELSRRAQEARL